MRINIKYVDGGGMGQIDSHTENTHLSDHPDFYHARLTSEMLIGRFLLENVGTIALGLCEDPLELPWWSL